MAENIHAQEAELFWLPSEFLTDEETISINTKDNLNNNNKNPNNFCFPSEFPFEEDQVVELTRQLDVKQNQRRCFGLVGSPQSTLSQFGTHFGLSPVSSNGGSPNGPSQVSSPTTQFAPGANSLDLIYQAAAQVAELKIKVGDFSVDTIRGNLASRTNHVQQNFNNSPDSYKTFVQQLRDEEILKQQQYRAKLWSMNQSKNRLILQQQQNQLSGSYVGACLENDQSAWPSLQYVMQKNIQKNCGNRAIASNVGSGNGYFNSAKKSSAGTGVFLPRCYESRPNKRASTGGSTASFHGRGEMSNAHVSRGGCGQPQWQPRRTGGFYSDYEVQLAQKNAMLIHQRNNHIQQVALGQELCLPQEWTY